MGDPVDLDLDEIDIPAEGITFRLDGRVWHCKPRGAMSPKLTDILLRQTETALPIDTFLRFVLVADEVDEFLARLGADDFPLTIDRWDAFATKMIEAIFNRPTERPRPSERGSRNTARTSKAASSSRGKKSTA